MKQFLFVIVFFLVIDLIFAIPVKSIPIKVMQPNGDSITIIRYGDEYGTWYETLDGYVIKKNSSNYWVYVNASIDGNLILTNQIVNSVSSPTGINSTNVFNTIENNRVNAYEILHNDSLFLPDFDDEETIMAIQQGVEYDIERAKATVKNKGSINVLTILIQFQDVKFNYLTTIKSYVENLMGGTNFQYPNSNEITGSVKEYWEEISYGQLSINAIVVGPYTAKYTIDNYKTTWNDDNSLDASNTRNLIKEAIKEAAKDVNMQLFDNDSNGFVDFVHIICAGSEDDIWPHRSSIGGILRDWKWISNYIITSEQDNGMYVPSIGTICHEMGHAFGAPDFYDRNYEINEQFEGTGEWDLMADGNYNNSKHSPAHPNPYIKTEIYGWATAKELSGNNKLYTLRPSELDKNSIYKLSTSTSGEYYLLENRQNPYLPGTGLVIYHVNSGIENVDRSKINIQHPQNLYVVVANNHRLKPEGVGTYGNINSPTATFKDTITNNIFFTSQTKPSNCAWNGTPTQNKDVCFISEEMINGEKCVKFVLNPEIEGPDVLCDSAIYSLQHVPTGATIEWDFERYTGSEAYNKIPFFIGSGQGTANVIFRRGIQRSGVISEPYPEIPAPPMPYPMVTNSINSNILFAPYQGTRRIYAHVTFNGNRYTLEKEIYMPKDLVIDDMGYGEGNPLRPNTPYLFSLKYPVESNWESNVEWTISDINGTYTRYGNSTVVNTGNSIAISLIAKHLVDCNNTKSDTLFLQVIPNGGVIFQNPASGNVEISVINGDASDVVNGVQSMAMNQSESYMGAYRLELWHDIYGKVREMDVPENTPTVTMNVDGLNSGIYILRLIIDNQLIQTSQMIIK